MLRRGLFLGALVGAASAVRLPTFPGIDRLIGGTQSPEDRLAWIEAELNRLEQPLRDAERLQGAVAEMGLGRETDDFQQLIWAGSNQAVEQESKKLSQSTVYQGLIKESQSIRQSRSQNAFGGAQAIRDHLAQGIKQQTALGEPFRASLSLFPRSERR